MVSGEPTLATFYRQVSQIRGSRYGETRVDNDGQMILIGLRNENLQKLGPHN
jgi:hypothetical protein